MEDSKRISLSFFNSPKLFTNFASKGFHETETTIMSPTSILDSKPFSGFKKNHFWSETTNSAGRQEHKRCCWEKHESKVVVGLGLVDVLVEDEKNSEVNSKVENRTVLFGSQLKIQIPSFSSSSESSSSPLWRGDFGIKTRNSHLGSSSGSFSNSSVGKSSSVCGGDSVVENGNLKSGNGVFKGGVSASEMELSEDYTRVICRGANPRTTHIFDNCVIESSCFDFGCSVSVQENGNCFPHRPTSYYHQYENFLSFCFYCKKNLEQGKDIYMYRGEMAFCSHECRSQGMSILEAKDV